MPAVPVADQYLLLSVHVPLLPAQFAGGRHGHPIPAFEIGRRQNIHPTSGIALQLALGFFAARRNNAEKNRSYYERAGDCLHGLAQFVEHG